MARQIPESPERQLRAFIAKLEPEHQRIVRAARRQLRARWPATWELVYDNYNFFVIGYSPTHRPSDAVVSLTAAANGVALCFIRGAALPDPDGLLQGSGRQTRFIRLPAANVLAENAVEALLAAAEKQARAAFRATGKPQTIIRSVSARQRPRRRAGSTKK